MDIHYNAFISYRHHPADIKVATQIHRLLEHYKVPKSLRKNGKGITRLFRDKDELPITSNLTTDITQALRNSDYLIVICSTHTKESVWVQREIETFLTSHDRSKVLTVLVDGEPYDIIPEILLKEEFVDPLSGEVTVKDIEPLSCDWRVNPRKAKREELPRLAAALLGCGYNELRQRERQYRTRRMIAAFSVAMAIVLAFLGYFIYSNVRIQKNLDKALKNQSMFLSNMAANLLEDGDRLTAIALALEALPQYEGERPYIAEAELALSNAVGIYESQNSVMAVGVLDCDYLVRDFKVTKDGSMIYVQDDRYVVTVWDCKTLEKIGTAALEFLASQMIPTSEGNMLLFSDLSYQVLCCAPDGTILWSAKDCQDMTVLDGQDVLLAVSSIYTDYATPIQFCIRFLDVHTGEEVREAITFEGPDANMANIHFLQASNPADMPVGLRLAGWDKDLIYMMDTDFGTVEQLYAFEDCDYEFAGRTREGNVLYLYNDGGFSMRGTYDQMTTTQKDTFILACLDHVTGQILWESSLSTYVLGSMMTLEPIPESDKILCQLDNAFLVLDGATGQILSRCDTASCPIWTSVGTDSAMFLLENGHMGTYLYSDDECNSFKYMPSDLVVGEVVRGAYVARNLSTQIMVYRTVENKNWVPYAGDYRNNGIRNHLLFDDYLAVQTNYDIYLIDTKQNAFVWSDGSDTYFDTELLGVSADAATLWCVYDDTVLVAYDVHTGTAEKLQLPRKADTEDCRLKCEHYLAGNKVYYVGQGLDTDVLYLFCYDINSQEYAYWTICTEQPTDGWNSQKTEIVAYTDTYILLWENTNKALYELDLITGHVSTVMTEVMTAPAVLPCGGETYLLGTNNMIQRCNRKGDVEMTIQLDGINVGGFCLHGDDLLVLCDDGNLYRYTSDGRYVTNAGLYVYSTFQSNMMENPHALAWHFVDDDTLILDVYGYGNIIDCENWQVKASIKNLVAYLPEEDAVAICITEGNGGVGECPRMSTQQLMQEAQETLGNFELTEEQRVIYGLMEQ